MIKAFGESNLYVYTTIIPHRRHSRSQFRYIFFKFCYKMVLMEHISSAIGGNLYPNTIVNIISLLPVVFYIKLLTSLDGGYIHQGCWGWGGNVALYF